MEYNSVLTLFIPSLPDVANFSTRYFIFRKNSTDEGIIEFIEWLYHGSLGWSGGAMVLGKLPVPGRPTILITVGQGPIALAVGACGGGLNIFTLIYPFSSFSISLGDGSI